MASKKKKKAKKSLGRQVERPSYKKPRPKKYVEPKLPVAKKPNAAVDIPELFDVKDMSKAFSANGELSEASLKEAIKQIEALANQAIGNDTGGYRDDFKTDAEAKLETPVKIEVELPPGKTEQDVVRAINIVNSLMKDRYDAAIDEIRNLYGEEYHIHGCKCAWCIYKNTPKTETKWEDVSSTANQPVYVKIEMPKEKMPDATLTQIKRKDVVDQNITSTYVKRAERTSLWNRFVQWWNK